MRKKIEIFIRQYPLDVLYYCGIDETGEILFKSSYANEHRGVIELIGVVHALMYLKKNDINADVYTETKYIKECVENKKYKHEAKSEKGKAQLRTCMLWLLDRKQTIIIYLNEKQNETEKI